MMKKLLYYVVAFFALFISSDHLQAQQVDTLLGYEDFLVQPRPLNGTPGGRGWRAEWFVQNQNDSSAGYAVSNMSKLNYPGLRVVGNYANGGLAYLTAGRDFDLSETGPFQDHIKASETQRVIGRDDSTLWVSFLLKLDRNSPDGLRVLLSSGNYLDGAKVLAGFGYFGDSSKVDNNNVWTLKVDTNYYRTAQPIVMGETVLAVMKLQFAEVDTISLYLNPTESEIISGTEPIVFNTQGITGQDFGIVSLAVQLGNDTKNGSFDEFRIGNTYKSVLPVADIILPITSGEIAAEPIANDMAVLTWEPSTDNDSIWGYLIYRDDVLIDTVYGVERVDTISGLEPGMTYTFGASSFDISGNLSEDTISTTITMPLITGVAKANISSGVYLFPNPASQSLSYSFGEDLGNGLLSVIDQVGNVVYTTSIDGLTHGQFNISSLAAGSYVVLVETEKGNYRQLILKQ